MATVNVASPYSPTQVNAAITSASNGDTVLIPGSGALTWSASVTLPSTKYLTLNLNGRAVTLSGASGELIVNAHATGQNRLTNGSIIRGAGYDQYSGPFQIADERGSAALRVDNLTFTGSNVLVELAGKGAGVMDHCTFPSLTAAQEFIHITAWGPGGRTGWTNDSGDSLAGSGNIFYIEDTDFTGAAGLTDYAAWIQGYYGCRIAIRYCTFEQVSIDMHGAGGGARWWEIYRNTFTRRSQWFAGYACSFRAGSGVIHNNSNLNYGSTIGLCEEDSGYPAQDQIGRGLNQVLDPARVWSNTNITLAPDECDAPEVVGMVQLNRDVYASARPGYTEYTYPHPAIGGASPPTGTPVLSVR